MRQLVLVVLAFLALAACRQSENKATSAPGPVGPVLATGAWRMVLASPGGDLPFRLEVAENGGRLTATAHNGAERLAFDRLEIRPGGEVVLGIEHYDSYFEGQLSRTGEKITGTWRKVVDGDRTAELPFEATFGVEERFPASPGQPEDVAIDLSGRWAVTFAGEDGEDEPAMAEFQQRGGHLTGTFLTPTGDYRFLEGVVRGRDMAVSCFDGGHAFLFKAVLGEDDILRGDFWSSDKWHQAWTAKRDAEASLPDPYRLTHVQDETAGFRFRFADLEGQPVAHDDPSLAGKVRLITIFGSWCPNCNDEAPMLQELYEAYRERGFTVLGLAFEATGDRERDIRMLKKFQKRHDLSYPILLAGQRDKADASEALPDLNRVLAYPTTLLIDRDGEVASIHTGFTGPGTGGRYDNLKAAYREKIEALLAE